MLSSICLSERKSTSLELDLQAANVTAEECGCVYASDDPSNKRTEMHELFNCEGEDFCPLLLSFIICPYLINNVYLNLA